MQWILLPSLLSLLGLAGLHPVAATTHLRDLNFEGTTRPTRPTQPTRPTRPTRPPPPPGPDCDPKRGDLDCSLNGECVQSSGHRPPFEFLCDCDPQWEGDSCERLRLLPADAGAGLQAKGNFSSWGGSVERGGAAGNYTYHMYAAVMANGCGLDAWRPNSVIGHATSRTPAGPYTLQSIIKPHFAHSPEVLRGADGEWLVYHVGAGVNNKAPCPNPDAPTCEWATNCSRGCTGPQHPILSGLSFFGPASVMKAASPVGPWTDRVIGACVDVPGCEPNGSFPGNGNDQNPAPYVNKDGSVTMLWRSINYTKGSGQSYYAAASAPRWAGPYVGESGRTERRR